MIQKLLAEKALESAELEAMVSSEMFQRTLKSLQAVSVEEAIDGLPASQRSTVSEADEVLEETDSTDSSGVVAGLRKELSTTSS